MSLEMLKTYITIKISKHQHFIVPILSSCIKSDNLRNPRIYVRKYQIINIAKISLSKNNEQYSNLQVNQKKV